MAKKKPSSMLTEAQLSKMGDETLSQVIVKQASRILKQLSVLEELSHRVASADHKKKHGTYLTKQQRANNVFQFGLVRVWKGDKGRIATEIILGD